VNSRIVLSTLTAIGLAVATGPAAGEEVSPQDLFETKCSACHATSRPLSKNKDRAGWEQTVQRMQGKRAGHLSDAEVETIIDYLTEVRGK
jgi:cytochrome c5